MKNYRSYPLAVAALAFGGLSAPAFGEQVRLHGSTTVIDRVITANKAAVEKATGHTLEVTGNGTGKGLVDLHEGRCDAALSSESLDLAAGSAATAGKQVDRTKLQFSFVMNDEIVFVVHPSNPVSSLTWEQARDIQTGKIKNWKELGGMDKPITVFSEPATGATRAVIRTVVMGGQEFSPTVVSLTSVKKVAELVAVDASGFGGLSKGFADSRTKIVQTKKLERPLGFITIGPPSSAVKAVIDAFKAQVAKK